MIDSLSIKDFLPDKSSFRPGETVSLIVKFEAAGPTQVRLEVSIFHLAEVVHTINERWELHEGFEVCRLSWVPPRETPCGYGAQLQVFSTSGALISAASCAFDVLEHWRQSPRYGFLSDFPPERKDIPEVMETINRYHLNLLQFYDWMYRHDEFLTDRDPYDDPSGRTLSRKSVEALIAGAHARNAAAMAYTAVYASSMEFLELHPDWAMFGPDGKPVIFGDNFLAYMDPRPGSSWVSHLLDQFDRILRNTSFDGIHLDQYGDPKVGYDKNGASYPVDRPLAEIINATQRVVRTRRPTTAVAFNAVTNWPIEVVAPADQDIAYIEVWPPFVRFADLAALVVQAQTHGQGKAVVIAAYISPSLAHNVLLSDAIVFSNGGYRIELGENAAMLADPYFPKHEPMPEALARSVRRYYDFAVRYENLIGASTRDESKSYRSIEVEGEILDPAAVGDTLLVSVRDSPGRCAISFVNLLGLESYEWREGLGHGPRELGPSRIRLVGRNTPVRRLLYASPDETNISLRELSFDQTPDRIEFVLPGLVYWDLILIEWER